MPDVPFRRLLPLWGIAAALGGAAAAGTMLSDPANQLPAILAWVAIVVLLELPSVAWRMGGGRPWTTLLVAIAAPLVPLEILLGIQAHKYAHAGGDLQGIELLLMEYVVPPLVLVTAFVVAGLACLLVRPEREGALDMGV